ncbi:MAG: transcriptional repressor [Lachnospiraceae bacterium]|nr:transcriptional repressor [Lachnospiraceae bacterium]
MKEYSTRAKSDILDFFKENPHKQVSASEVFKGLEAKGSHLNLATVYRNLDRMTDEKVLIKYKSVDNSSSIYQFAESMDGHDCYNHLHLKCRSCGRIVHLECDFMKEIAGHLFEHHGFTVSCEGSVIMGLCKECGND